MQLPPLLFFYYLRFLFSSTAEEGSQSQSDLQARYRRTGLTLIESLICFFVAIPMTALPAGINQRISSFSLGEGKSCQGRILTVIFI